jgi:hypothetical protein
MDLNSLLKGPLPQEQTTTLNEVLEKAATSWTTQDLESIVEGLRQQRQLWSAEQAKGSRKLVRSSAVPVKKKGKFASLQVGLKKVQL